jgi:hypothetical protein
MSPSSSRRLGALSPIAEDVKAYVKAYLKATRM